MDANDLIFAVKVHNLLSVYTCEDRHRVVDYFLQVNSITANDFTLWLDDLIVPIDVDKLLIDLLRLGCLQSLGCDGFYKTPPFVRFLKRELLSRSIGFVNFTGDKSVEPLDFEKTFGEIGEGFKEEGFIAEDFSDAQIINYYENQLKEL